MPKTSRCRSRGKSRNRTQRRLAWKQERLHTYRAVPPHKYCRQRPWCSSCNLRRVYQLKPCNLLHRNFDFLFFTERECEHGQEGADNSHTGHPPDVPDHRKTEQDRKKRGDESDCTALWHLN